MAAAQPHRQANLAAQRAGAVNDRRLAQTRLADHEQRSRTARGNPPHQLAGRRGDNLAFKQAIHRIRDDLPSARKWAEPAHSQHCPRALR